MNMRFVNIISFDRSYQFLGESSESCSARDLSDGGDDDWKLWAVDKTIILLLSFTPLHQLLENYFTLEFWQVLSYFSAYKSYCINYLPTYIL